MKPSHHLFSGMRLSGQRPMDLISSKILLYVVIVVSIFFAYQTLQVMVKRSKTESDIKTFEKQVSDLQSTQNRLQELNQFLGTDFFAEKEARLKLGMQKVGEEVVVLNDTGASVQKESSDSRSFHTVSPTSGITSHADITSSMGVSVEKQKSNPAKWWDYFFAHNNNE
ncbi:MAG: septum formation initiator family protein [bacterium]|nr:septum formation initiator family protein [bacterium]